MRVQFLQYFLYWLPMIFLAFSNAALRQLVFIKYMNELRAHQVSTIVLIIVCSFYIWFIFPFIKLQNTKEAFLIGLFWVALTILFEFIMGLISNRPMSTLFHDYNILAGRIWILFLLSLFFLPFLCFILKY